MKQIPVEIAARMIEAYIYQKTGSLVTIKLPLVTDREKGLFIKAFNCVV